ncbi:bifunctional DNA primase/polymerase [Streptomyces olivaceus]|uniref:bifunctional DNA primase/polymerase n=1 Tax=Streptomyces olivaceus TaxID=47716 RepID=UPI001CCDDEE5|nr:bifunctional DNA primase/polymerase [Streptomyces olivaceus]MBZ6231060.1 bifunctional DNA primase/polymerase [Streptomyces olivaceus]
MEETIPGTEAAQIPQQRGTSPLETAVRYAEERHWDVFPGTWLVAADGRQLCSCGAAACAAPGAHPAREDWAAQATGSASAARRMWEQQPTASVLLPTGRTFDAVDVPETAGFLALARMERMELALGPVTLAPDRRMRFFVLPGAAVKVPELVRRLGRPPRTLDLGVLGEGAYVAAPPTRFGARGAVQWACRPTPANRWLPDVEELIPSLAYACGRER